MLFNYSKEMIPRMDDSEKVDQKGNGVVFMLGEVRSPVLDVRSAVVVEKSSELVVNSRELRKVFIRLAAGDRPEF